MNPIEIVFEENVLLPGRSEAGRVLGEHLKKYRGDNTVVIGIPRGGIVVASDIAKSIDAPMDFVLCHKLRSVCNPEAALGAITQSGDVLIKNPSCLSITDRKALEKEKLYQLDLIKKREKIYRGYLPKAELKGRTVIVTDDGVAMGSTMEAALVMIRKEKPAKLIMAVPVGPRETVLALSALADETLCLLAPRDFSAVSQFYLDFAAVEDWEIFKILESENERRSHWLGLFI